MSKEQKQQQGKEEGSEETQVSNKEVMDKLGEIEKSMAAGKEISAEDQKLIEAILANEDEGTKKQIKIETESIPSQTIDDMSNSQLVDHVVKALKEENQKLKEELTTSQKESEKKAIKIEVDREIDQAHGKYGKEFEEKWDDIMKTAEKHPTLTVEESFLLASGKTTYAELSEKIKSEKEKKDKLLSIQTSSGGIDDSALLEKLEGKTHKDVALEIAQKLGMKV